MSDVYKKSKLGELLVKQGALSRQGLDQAILEQRMRKQTAQAEGRNANSIPALGELLIELGLINKRELAQALSWQKKLRKTTIALGFLAPLLSPTMAQAASFNEGDYQSNPIAASYDRVSQRSTLLNWWFSDKKEASTNAFKSTPAGGDSDASPNSGTPFLVSSISELTGGGATTTPDQPTPEPEPAPNTDNVDDTPDTSDDTPTTLEEPSPDPGPDTADDTPPPNQSDTPPSTPDTVLHSVNISWSIPDTRENGDTLEIYEISGYEVLYRKSGDTLFTSEVISNPQATGLVIAQLQVGDYDLKIATIDLDGVYSKYTIANFNIK